MSAAVELFTYNEHQQIRVVVIDGEPWFVLADLCRVLGIANAGNVAARLDYDVKGIRSMDTPGGTQSLTIVNESGMYECVIRSDKPEAVAFRRWITREVLPAIRKTGSYAIEPQFAVPQNYGDALRAAAEQWERADEAESRVKELDAWTRELEPAAAVTAFLADAEGADFSFSDAAKILCRHPRVDIGQRRLFDRLSVWGWIYRPRYRTGWRAYQAQVDAGRLVERIGEPFDHPVRGRVMPDPQVRITVKGLGDILQRLTGDRELPAELRS
jgi:prophage antirepressor-like protein